MKDGLHTGSELYLHPVSITRFSVDVSDTLTLIYMCVCVKQQY